MNNIALRVSAMRFVCVGLVFSIVHLFSTSIAAESVSPRQMDILGIRLGMPLSEAKALRPSLTVTEEPYDLCEIVPNSVSFNHTRISAEDASLRVLATDKELGARVREMSLKLRVEGVEIRHPALSDAFLRRIGAKYDGHANREVIESNVAKETFRLITSVRWEKTVAAGKIGKSEKRSKWTEYLTARIIEESPYSTGKTGDVVVELSLSPDRRFPHLRGNDRVRSEKCHPPALSEKTMETIRQLRF